MMLTEEQRSLRRTARAFAQAEIAPKAAEWDRTGDVPRDLYRRMGEVGLMGMCVDPAWGGSGVDFVSYCLAMEEISAADGGISNVMAANNSPVAAAIEQYGDGRQKSEYLTKLCSGEWIGCIHLTEPHTGSDAAAITTRAARDGDHWVLSGQKSFITAGSLGDVAMITAVTDPGAGRSGISVFVTPTDNPGYQVIAKEQKLGHRTNDTCQIAFDNMRIPAGHLLGEEGKGLGIVLGKLSVGRVGVAAQSVGGARAAWRAAYDYAQERETFGRPIIGHQAIAFRLAEMATEIEAARHLYLHAAALEDAHRTSGAATDTSGNALDPRARAASMAKLFASEMAERVASAAIQIHGGYGFLNDYPVEKIYRDVRVYQIYEGTSEVQKLVISRLLDDVDEI